MKDCGQGFRPCFVVALLRDCSEVNDENRIFLSKPPQVSSSALMTLGRLNHGDRPVISSSCIYDAFEVRKLGLG